ncbi:unnamed protein product [Lota lota]
MSSRDPEEVSMGNMLTPFHPTATKPNSRETIAEVQKHAGPGNRVVGVETTPRDICV